MLRGPGSGLSSMALSFLGPRGPPWGLGLLTSFRNPLPSLLGVILGTWFMLTGSLTRSVPSSPPGSNTTVQKHQFFGIQPSFGSTLTSVHDYWKNQPVGEPLDTRPCLAQALVPFLPSEPERGLAGPRGLGMEEGQGRPRDVGCIFPCTSSLTGPAFSPPWLRQDAATIRSQYRDLLVSPRVGWVGCLRP